MQANEISTLWFGLWNDLKQPDVLWQLLSLTLCWALAWLAARSLRRPTMGAGAWRMGHGSLNRLLFPLFALTFVLIAREGLKLGNFHVNILSVAIPLLMSFAVVRVVVYTLRYAFNPSGWLATFERIVIMVVWGVVALHITGLLPDVVLGLESVTFAVGKQKLSLWIVLQGAVTVLVTMLLALWISGILEARLDSAESLDVNLRLVLVRLTKVGLLLLAVLLSLPMVGIDLTALSVFGGALGVGIGFGLQKIASNYVAGFIILLDRSIRIGNMITVDKFSGQVTQITTRYTVLRALNGVESIVPNEMLIGSVVQNEAYTNPKMRQFITVQIGYESDLNAAMQLLAESAQSHQRVLSDPPPETNLIRFAESGIELELRFWISDSHEGSTRMKSEINLAIWAAFKQAGIVIPYPRREVRLLAPLPPFQSVVQSSLNSASQPQSDEAIQSAEPSPEREPKS